MSFVFNNFGDCLIAFEILLDLLSSPNWNIISASSLSDKLLIRSAAVVSWFLSKRISILPFFLNENPLLSELSCKEESPRSRSIPSTFWIPSSSNIFFILSYELWCNDTRFLKELNRFSHIFNASSSLSIPINLPFGESIERIWFACPPAPMVPSM